MNAEYNIYSEYNSKKEKTAGLIGSAAKIFHSLNLVSHQNQSEELKRNIENGSFKVQVIGTFKNGKSTFINSLLGEEVLPAYATPCTAVINELKYSKDKKAKLYFKNKDEIRELPSSIPQDIKNHIESSTENAIEPIDIDVEDIEKYAVIPMTENPKEMLKESPYSKIELFWPLALLENKVDIVDSPGLNENEVRTQVTTQYLKQADAILFVLAADKLCAQDEMEFIENTLKKYGFTNIMFIVNRFDTLRTERDRDAIKGLAHAKLDSATSLGNDGVFFVSAINALDGKIDGNKNLYNISGMPQLEKRLAEYLTNDRGKVKLTRPINYMCSYVIPQAKEDISKLAASLDKSLEELEQKCQEAEPKISELIKEKEQFKTDMDNIAQQAVNAISDEVGRFFKDLDTNMEVWVEEFHPENEVSSNPLKVKESANLVCGEILNHLSERITSETSEWEENNLNNIITYYVNQLEQKIEHDGKRIFMELDRIKFDITSNDNEAYTPGDIPVWQRLAAATAGLVATGIGGAAVGAMEGFTKDFVKTILIQFTAIMSLSFLSLLNPITLVGTIVATLLFNSTRNSDKTISVIKDKIVDKIREDIANKNAETMNRVIAEFESSIFEYGDNAAAVIDGEIKAQETFINSLISQRQSEEFENEREKERLSGLRNQLDEISDSLNDIAAIL